MIHRIVQALRFTVPWVLRGIGWTLSMAFTGFAALWLGLPQAVRRITNLWMRQASNSGIPIGYLDVLEAIISIVAFGAVLVSWLVLAFLTVLIFTLIF